MKKLLCAVLALSVAATAMTASAAPTAAAGETVRIDGVPCVFVGENLFESPNFTEGGRREAPQWYVGDNEGTSWNGSVPDPKTEAGLTPLEETVLESEQAANGKQAFYYSEGGALDFTGSDSFLCEYITSPEGSFWNGKRAL